MDSKDKAVLLSPELELLDWSCLRMVYQITGKGSLQLHLRPDGENFDYTLWTSEKTSDSWLIASVDLRNMTKPYQVSTESTTVPAGVLSQKHEEPKQCAGSYSYSVATVGCEKYLWHLSGITCWHVFPLIGNEIGKKKTLHVNLTSLIRCASKCRDEN